MMLGSPLHASALRLLPGQDLVGALLDHCESQQYSATSILSCVGSLSVATIRLAGAQEIITLNEDLEIVSLVGTLCADRDHHLHISLARRDGSVIGGHCKGDAIVATTAEVVLGVLPALSFRREIDVSTGYKELLIAPAGDNGPNGESQ